jgi:hypothetical protein
VVPPDLTSLTDHNDFLHHRRNGDLTMSSKNTCNHGHSANSYGNCFVNGCPDEHRPSRNEDGNARAWSERSSR